MKPAQTARNERIRQLFSQGVRAKQIAKIVSAETGKRVSVAAVYNQTRGGGLRWNGKLKYSSTYMLSQIGFDYARAKQNELV